MKKTILKAKLDAEKLENEFLNTVKGGFCCWGGECDCTDMPTRNWTRFEVWMVKLEGLSAQ